MEGASTKLLKEVIKNARRESQGKDTDVKKSVSVGIMLTARFSVFGALNGVQTIVSGFVINTNHIVFSYNLWD